MKSLKTFCFLALAFFTINFANAQTSPTQDSKGIYYEVTGGMFFQGGEPAMYPWINANTHMPDEAVQNAVKGTIWVKFVVNEDGSISDAYISMGKLGFGCEEEALRVINSMPKWNPGTVNGKPVKAWNGAQINFNYTKPNPNK